MAKAKENTTEPVEEKTAPVQREIVPATVDQLGAIALKTYDTNDITAFGESFAASLIAQAAIEEEAQRLTATGNEAKQFLAFEMTRAAFDLSKKFEDDKLPVDIYAIFGEPKDVKILNRNVLFHLGILKREIEETDEGSKYTYVFASKKLADLYEYTEELKKKDEAEYTRRFNNRKRLNQRLSDAFKAAVILRDQGLSSDDLFYSQDEATGEFVPTVRNAPKAIGGDKGVFQMNARTPVAGAKLSPTMSSLVKMANDKHKGENAPSKGRDEGEKRDGEAKLGMDDEAFGRIVNTLRTAVTTQEGNLTEEMKKHLFSLNQFLVETLNNAK